MTGLGSYFRLSLCLYGDRTALNLWKRLQVFSKEGAIVAAVGAPWGRLAPQLPLEAYQTPSQMGAALSRPKQGHSAQVLTTHNEVRSTSCTVSVTFSSSQSHLPA